MLSIEELRNTLPDKGKDLTDEQITKVRDDLYALVNMCIDMYLKEHDEAQKLK